MSVFHVVRTCFLTRYVIDTRNMPAVVHAKTTTTHVNPFDAQNNDTIIIIIITVLITHYAKPQCVYKYEYRQLYITITIIYYMYMYVIDIR